MWKAIMVSISRNAVIRSGLQKLPGLRGEWLVDCKFREKCLALNSQRMSVISQTAPMTNITGAFANDAVPRSRISGTEAINNRAVTNMKSERLAIAVSRSYSLV